jgi:dienelactone hydrolase
MPHRPAALLALFLLLVSSATHAQPLPGTQALDAQGDLASQMVAGIDKFLLREIERSVERRAAHWKRDFSSAANYEKSIEPNREHLKRFIGAQDERVKPVRLEVLAGPNEDRVIGRGPGYEILAVRWPVLPGVEGEGLLLVPAKGGFVDCIAIPDAAQTPEMLVGLAPGVPAEAQFARRLVENDCRVLVPLLMDRRDKYSAITGRPPTNQPHREFIYRPAFEMGRHIIGLELQKVLAAIDWFVADRSARPAPVGVYGYGEGGLLALYAGAIDPRIRAAAVSGYFDSRQHLWQEPIYRNVFGLLTEFGDAELASMVTPRTLIIEASKAPEVSGPPPAGNGHSGGAAPGRLVTPPLQAVQQEVQRAHKLVADLSPAPRIALVPSDGGNGPPGCDKALGQFLTALRSDAGGPAPAKTAPTVEREGFDREARFKRQFDQLVEYTQHLMREGEYARRAFWTRADRSSVEKWQKTTEPYRDYFATEVIGRFDEKLQPANVRTRKVYDEPKYTGYEVMMDVFPDVFAYGLLLLPRDIREGERRPVVVCQHGLEGRPRDVADPKVENPAYHQFACKLAERGFITYAPQNPYIFTDRFRTLQRKLNPLKKTLFSIIVPQHQQAVDWLASLPMVDPERIAFYGLSYGGKSAMRIPPLVSRYCLSICSADFNEWIWKNTSTRSTYSYVGYGEYEIFEFDLGNTFNYAEMAGLIAPRPFMVERGHHDGVAPNEWVAYEYAKVRKLYSDLKLPERTRIEFFDGPHTIHGVGTFDFLHTHLKWPKPQK